MIEYVFRDMGGGYDINFQNIIQVKYNTGVDMLNI